MSTPSHTKSISLVSLRLPRAQYCPRSQRGHSSGAYIVSDGASLLGWIDVQVQLIEIRVICRDPLPRPLRLGHDHLSIVHAQGFSPCTDSSPHLSTNVHGLQVLRQWRHMVNDLLDGYIMAAYEQGVAVLLVG